MPLFRPPLFARVFSPCRGAPPVLLIFDYDGVIADSFDVYFSEFTAACREMGFHHINSREAFLQLFDGNLIK